MPGIVGLISKTSRERAESQLQRMLDVSCHDSALGMGTWTDQQSGVYVGWTARRHSFADGMPLCNERRDTVLLFSGEEYAEPGAARGLRERGHVLDARGPSYLVHLAEEDPVFPAGLNGRFHGLLALTTNGVVTLFNDRYGIHRLYYHESPEAFYFAAEAKAILAVRPELRTLDPRGLGEFVACGCVLENRTLFKGLHVLPPAAAWVFRKGVIERKAAYFQPEEWETQVALDEETYYQELRNVFSRNLPRYFNGEQQIGMSLTGGLDTRMIMAWQKPQPGSLPCYSFGSTFHDTQDVIVARRVARACEQPHDVISVGEDFLDRFASYAERTVHLTDGCVSVRHAADLYVNERAAAIAPVRMTGNYGGEMLRRVRAFKPVEPAPGLFAPELRPLVDAAKDTYVGLLRGHPLTFAAFKQTPWHHYGLLALEQTQLSLRSPYLDNDFVRTLFRAPESTLANNDVCLRLIAEGDTTLRRIRTDRGLAGDDGRLRAAVARILLGLSFRAEYGCDYGMPQWAARINHRSPFKLENVFLGRHKFSHFRVWYRDALSGYVRDILLDPQTMSRPYLQTATLEARIQSHLRGNGNYTSEIHLLLTLELIHRLFLDRR